jgi:sialate O-acetylesterase
MPQSTTPLDDFHSVQLPWSVASSKRVSYSDWDYFSAVCWLSGKQIYLRVLQAESIPLGLMVSSWGGTIIEAWSPPYVSENCNGSFVKSKSDVDNADSLKKGIFRPVASGAKVGDEINPNAHAVLYNNMIVPFQHMRIQSVLWYQGESNANEVTPSYTCMQQEMMKAWRTLFSTNFPFIYFQIATWNTGATDSFVAKFRNAQFDILSSSANVAMVTAADLGDPDSPFGDIHPRYKSELGRRVGLAASTLIYTIPQPHEGPVIERIEILQDTTAPEGSSFSWYVRLHFDAFSCGEEGVQLQSAQVCPGPSMCAGMYLVYSDPQRIVEAQITVSGKSTVDLSPVIPQGASIPVQLSYGQADYPMMTIYNSIGVPLLPFIKTIGV